MRFWRRLAKVMGWGLVVIGVISAGLAWFAYKVVTDSEWAAQYIKGQAARYFRSRSLTWSGSTSA